MKFARPTLSTVLLIVISLASDASAFAPRPMKTTTTTQKSQMRTMSFLEMSGVLTPQTGQSSLDPTVIAKYQSLGFPSDKILAEYVWVDADGNTQSKTQTLPASKGKDISLLPKWNFDGSSTGQEPGDDLEVILK
jgi:hypothetical protein